MDRTEKRLTFWWAVLTALTLVSFEAGSSSEGMLAVAATVGIFVLAFAKVAVVISEFMDVRSAPRALQLGLAAWGIVVSSGLISQWVML